MLNTTQEGRKDGVFDLMTHSTHFILRLYGFEHMLNTTQEGKKDGVFDLMTHSINFILRLYGFGHVKCHSGRKEG